jgi:hypothetical protein
MEVEATLPGFNKRGSYQLKSFFKKPHIPGKTIDGVVLYNRFGKISKSIIPSSGNLLDNIC